MPRGAPSSSYFEGIDIAYRQAASYWNYISSVDHINHPTATSPDQEPGMDAEPGVGLPDLSGSYVQQLYFRPRQPSAAIEQWLMAESPIARATSASSQQPAPNSYRLPSLSFHTPIPDGSAQCYEQHASDMASKTHATYTTLHEQNPSDHFSPSDLNHELDLINLRDTSLGTVNASARTDYQGMPWVLGQDYMHTRYPSPSLSPYSSSTILNGSPAMSEYCSSPEFYPRVLDGRIPRSQPKDDQDIEEGEDMNGGKPYAQLIQECLLQAPGHKMMLRDIYEWFEANTSKPLECGGNGWQNSIRHNLSMNQAFENDKTMITNSRGEAKKSTSIWYLTDHALRYGVQSTTRYRKHNLSRRSPYSYDRDYKRMCSGSKGGKAARKATHMRRLRAERWPRRMSSESLKPFGHLVQAANASGDYPGSRGSSPSSPPDDYPCTPNDAFPSRDYPLENTMDPLCQTNDVSINDLQLHDALNQAGYGHSTDMMW